MIKVGEIRDVSDDNKLYNNWIKKAKKIGIKGISKISSNLVIKCLEDLSIGINISRNTKKGQRSKRRLNALKQKLIFIIKQLEKRKIKDIRKTKPKDLHKLFSDMRGGGITTRTGTAYKSTGDYIKDFKTFWHWYQKVEKKQGKLIEDITEDLDSRGEKPKFVYFTENDFKKLLRYVSYDLKPTLALAYDSGMRVKELINVRVSDFSNDFKELQIREETAKTFGRKIKLMLCSQQVKDYIEKLNLKSNDFLIQHSPKTINKELNELGKKYLTPEQTRYKNLTLYDFRHSSCCFWLPKYKSESALKYRFGWMKSDMIHYYSEFLGMKDTIREEDLYDDLTKTELEKKYNVLEQRYNLLKETQNKTAKEMVEVFTKFQELKDIITNKKFGKKFITGVSQLKKK